MLLYSQIKCKQNSPTANRKLIGFLLCKDDELFKISRNSKFGEIRGYNHFVRRLSVHSEGIYAIHYNNCDSGKTLACPIHFFLCIAFIVLPISKLLLNF